MTPSNQPAQAPASVATRPSTRASNPESHTAPPMASASATASSGHDPAGTVSPSSAMPTPAGTTVSERISGAVAPVTATRCNANEYSQKPSTPNTHRTTTRATVRSRPSGVPSARAASVVPAYATPASNPSVAPLQGPSA